MASRDANPLIYGALDGRDHHRAESGAVEATAKSKNL
jgi:hypothetical protein